MMRSIAWIVLAGLLTLLLPRASLVAAEKKKGPAKENSTDVKALQKERIDTLSQFVQIVEVHFRSGQMTFHQVALAQMKLADAKVDAAETLEERIARLEELVAVAKGDLEVVETRHRAGFNATMLDVLEARASYLEAKIRLARERAKLKPQAISQSDKGRRR